MYLLTLWYLSESQCTFAKSMRWYAAIGFRGTKNSERRSGQTSSRSYSKLYATISARPLGKDTVTIPNGKGKRQKAKGKGQRAENRKRKTENRKQKTDKGWDRKLKAEKGWDRKLKKNTEKRTQKNEDRKKREKWHSNIGDDIYVYAGVLLTAAHSLLLHLR